MNEVRSRRARNTNGNERKTHCKHGHPFSEENTYRTPRGARSCRICRAAAQQRRATKRREQRSRRNQLHLPVGPFKQWLEERLTAMDPQWREGTNCFNGGVQQALAVRLGLHPRRISSILCGQQQRVHIDIVDRALINELGDPSLLNEWYPVED